MHHIKDLPVLILGYNRYDKFIRCISSLQAQGIKKIYVSIDGPKNDFDKQIQRKISNFCSENLSDFNINYKNLKKNFGCRNGPIKGITWFFQENEYGVILEDDVIVSKKCIELFSLLLKEYQYNNNLMSISSFNEFTNNDVENLYDVSVFRSWGWASWSEKWKMHLDFSKKIRNLSLWEIYNLLPKQYRKIETAEIIKSCQLNLFDAWDYEFNFSHLFNNKKSLTIGGINNYVYGFDSFSTHTLNIEEIGIDFQLYCEREIDKSKILNLEKNKHIMTLKKCGFPISHTKNVFYLIIDMLKSLYYSLIFYLRITKRNLYKKL